MHENFHGLQLKNRGYVGTNQDVWYQWLNTKGYTGRTLTGLELEWLKDQGHASGTLNGRYFRMYRDAGLTGALDDIGSKWVVPDGGIDPIGPAIPDPLWADVLFFHDFTAQTATKPAGGTASFIGNSVEILPTELYDVPGLNLQPTFNHRNALTCQFTPFTLDKAVGYTIDCWGKTIDIGPGGLPTWMELYTVGGSAVMYCGSSDNRGFTIGGSLGFTTSGSGSIPHDSWTHVAYVVKGNQVKIYSEGKLIHTSNYFGDPTGTGVVAKAFIGCRDSSSYPYAFKGKLSQIRITKGERWTAEFTPPTGPVLVP